MGRKGRRNTAKTGDKALYKKLDPQKNVSTKKTDSDDDAMYSKVDRFYNQRDEEDYIELTGGNDQDSDEDDELLQQEAVFDLGGGDVSDDSGEEVKAPKKTAAVPAVEDTDDSSSSSDEDEEEEEMDNVRDWGKKKSVYYHGDTADLEIGQEQEDAFVEEEAAKEVQMARLKEMSEQDFVLSDDEGEKDDEDDEAKGGNSIKLPALSISSKSVVIQGPGVGRDTSKWTIQQQQTFLQQRHPEFLPLVNHFTDVVEDLDQRTNVVVQALYEGDDENAAKTVGATREGERYLLSRALIQSSAALNLATYLLLKSDYSSSAQPPHTNSSMDDTDDNIMSSHPVLDHLQKLDNLAEKMEQLVKDTPLHDHMNSLVKASALLAKGEMEDDDDHDDDEENSSEEESKEDGEPRSDEEEENVRAKQMPMNEDEPSSSSDEEEDEIAKKAQEEAALMNEARFAVRPNEMGRGVDTSRVKRRRREAPDFGEDSQTEKGAQRSLATTVNALEQRFASKKSKANKSAASEQADQLDAFSDDDDNEVRRGLELMEAALGKPSDDEEDENAKGSDVDNDDAEDDYYKQVQQRSLAKKKERKEKYAVAPKFPRVEREVEGERALSHTIMKNRGLVAHKNKLNRNPRVKKREQYRKALIRRKGAVRSMRDSREGQAYGGEETGIKSNIRRSRNLT